MNNTDKEYFRLIDLILNKGRVKHNRTGINTIGIFGAQARFNLQDGFPILTTKKVFFKGIVHELLWFISGSTNIKYLVDNDVHIWDEWAYQRFTKTGNISDTDYRHGIDTQEAFINEIKRLSPENWFVKKFGNLGEGTYGSMWRKFPYYHDDYNTVINSDALGTVDQLKKVIDKLKTNPEDRRIIVSAWHPYWVDHCALPPCHCLFHFNTEELTQDERLELLSDSEYQQKVYYRTAFGENEENVFNEISVPKRRLNLQLYQRSCDTFLGVPFNISSYSLLLAMVAHVVGMVPGEFIHTYGDLHIYSNHIEQCKLQMSREPKNLPKLWLNPEVKSLFDFKYNDIKLEGYDPHPAIKGEVAV